MKNNVSDYFDIYNPNLKNFQSEKLPSDVKDKILNYLSQRSFVTRASTGRITDGFTNKKVENMCYIFYSDGTYEWNTTLIWYFKKYDIKLKSDFIKAVLS